MKARIPVLHCWKLLLAALTIVIINSQEVHQQKVWIRRRHACVFEIIIQFCQQKKAACMFKMDIILMFILYVATVAYIPFRLKWCLLHYQLSNDCSNREFCHYLHCYCSTGSENLRFIKSQTYLDNEILTNAKCIHMAFHELVGHTLRRSLPQ